MNKCTNEEVLGNLVMAIHKLEQCKEFTALIPEVRVNLVYALPDAASRFDVAAVDGRITAVGGFPKASGLPVFGASDHMARLIIEARKYDPEINAGINLKCDKSIIEIVKSYCLSQNRLFGWIDRTIEPESVTALDGMSMPWKIRILVQSSGGLPTIFYEGEGWGKEPLFVAIGKNAAEVAGIAIDLAKLYNQSTMA